MARNEIKLDNEVPPNAVQQRIEFWASFGWELKSRQTIKTKDSHQERRGDTIYNVTESEHYENLTFERDTSMPHYDELAALEKRYFSSVEEYDSLEKQKNSIKLQWEHEAVRLYPASGKDPVKFGCLFTILIAVCFILAFGCVGSILGEIQYGLDGEGIGWLVFGIVFLALGIFIIVWRKKRYAKMMSDPGNIKAME